MKTAKSLNCNNITGEDSVISLFNSYLEINLGVFHADGNITNANGNDTKLVDLGPLPLFSNANLTTGSIG